MSDSVRPHRRQPTRLPRPWDSPGKNTGVGCHFLLQLGPWNSRTCSRVRLLPFYEMKAPPNETWGFSKSYSVSPGSNIPISVLSKPQSSSSLEVCLTFFLPTELLLWQNSTMSTTFFNLQRKCLMMEEDLLDMLLTVQRGWLSSPSERPFHGLDWDSTLGSSSWIQDKAVYPWS